MESDVLNENDVLELFGVFCLRMDGFGIETGSPTANDVILEIVMNVTFVFFYIYIVCLGFVFIVVGIYIYLVL